MRTLTESLVRACSPANLHRSFPSLLLFSSLALATFSPSPVLAAPSLVVSEAAPFHYANTLAAPGGVRLASLNGGIDVSASSDGKLDVHAVVRGGDPSQVGQVRVIAREEAGGVAICILFTEESPDRCHLSGLTGQSSGMNHHNAPSVDLVARVPAGVSLFANSLNGAIHARGLTAEARVTTLNGDVEVTAGSVPEATTQNGSIDVTCAKPPTGSASFTTTNGNVKVTYPSALDADVEASTVNGEIKTSFPMTIDSTPGGHGPKSGHARVGKGGAHVTVHSVNGNVEVRSRD
jgi:hypothetical protein